MDFDKFNCFVKFFIKSILESDVIKYKTASGTSFTIKFMAFIAYIAPLILSFCLPNIIKLCVVKFEL